MAITGAVKSALGKLGKIGKEIIPEAGKSNAFFKYSKEGHTPLSFGPKSHYSLKKRYALGIPAAIALGSASNSVYELEEEAKLGGFTPDELSNTVNITRSPTLDPYLKKASTPEQIEELKRNQKIEQLKHGSATGDLVFALHNLRDGGGR